MKTQRIYYSIREVSNETGLSFPTLRYWEQVFPELSPRRNEGKTRFYTAADIELIKQIKFLRDEQQLSVPAIQQRLRTDRTGVDQKVRLCALLKEIRNELTEIRNTI